MEFKKKDDDSVCDEERNDPMVLTTTIVVFEVKRILANSRSAVEVLTGESYQKIGLKEKAFKKPCPLYGFANHPVEVKKCITLPVTLGDAENTTT